MMKTPTGKGPLRMLVVDDDATFRERLVRALKTRLFETYDAGDVDGALATARRVRPQRAIVDLRLGGRSGLDVVAGLASIDPTMQIVVLTGYGSIATAVEAVRRGALDYLTKPVDTEQILAAFDREADHAPPPAGSDGEGTPSLARVEWEHIQRILADCSGNISQASRVLGIHRRSLQRKLRKLPPLE